MNTKHFLIVAGLALGVSGSGYAAGCDGVTACQVPGTSGLSAPLASQITAVKIGGLSAKNSGTATANQGGVAAPTAYWFYAYNHGLAAPNLTSGSASFDTSDTTGDRVRAGSPNKYLTSPPNAG